MTLMHCPECEEVTQAGRACHHCGASCGNPSLVRPAMAVLLGLSIGLNTACIANKYGVPDTGFLDADEDGWGVEQDCDDGDPDVNPDAVETAGDGVDSNCDGEDDPATPI